jgi:hypothetical protein
VGNGAFTPDNLNTADPIRYDRPYASLLYLSFAHTIFNPHQNLLLRAELTVGFLGLPLDEKIQSFIHQDLRGDWGIRPYRPLGWNNQISNGGEPSARYLLAAQWGGPDAAAWLFRSRWHDLSLYGEASLGYYTNAAAGPVLRVGRIRSNFTTLTSNPITSANQVLVSPDHTASDPNEQGPGKPYYRRDDFELYAYATGRGRAVLYNALLEGQVRSSAVRVPWTNMNHFLAEGEFGVAGGAYGFTVTLALIAGRTAEYAYPNVAPRAHTWGGIYLTYRLPEPNPQEPK